MKITSPAIGTVFVWSTCAAALCLAYAWCSGYVIDVAGRTAVAPVPLHETPLDVLQRHGPFKGTVQPGTRCRLVNVETKALVSYRMKCGNLDGWTDEADSFDPRLGIGLFGSAE
ncbi:hypothetical protein [Cupriavidus necator]|uniref:hypothetical protein n=1 Tax=Cupriavidus necator TaxID=106590 RepID=UPI00140FDF65|nr:hypothetical protein [Cupriavidus necator]